VEIDPAIADRARLSVERMLDVGRSKMTEVAA
jgi:quinolinate synthase